MVRDAPTLPDRSHRSSLSLAAGLTVRVDDDALDDLIHRADLDGLVRLIDDRSGERDWAGLLRVRDRARHAVATGRQLWPAATLAEYRLALHAAPEFVAAVLDETDGLSGRFTIGPLTEVAAQHHSWADLSPELGRGPRAAFVAHERVLRGETIGAPDLPPVLDIPLDLQRWEPTYALADYTDAGAEFPPRGSPRTGTTSAPPTPRCSTTTSNSPCGNSSNRGRRVRTAMPRRCASTGTSAVRSVRSACGARVVELDPAMAIAWMAWAGASGGAHGRRRGAASGRFGAWWTLAAFGDLLDDWPVPPDELGELAHDLRWYRWDAHEPAMGWQLQLAVEDPEESVAWAIIARDAT